MDTMEKQFPFSNENFASIALINREVNKALNNAYMKIEPLELNITWYIEGEAIIMYKIRQCKATVYSTEYREKMYEIRDMAEGLHP